MLLNRRSHQLDWRLFVETVVVWATCVAVSAGILAALVAIVIPGGWPWWHVALVAAGIAAAAVAFVSALSAMDGLHL